MVLHLGGNDGLALRHFGQTESRDRHVRVDRPRHKRTSAQIQARMSARRRAPGDATAYKPGLILNRLVGQGEPAPEDAVRATLVVLANILARGTTPAGPALGQRVVDALNTRRHPAIRMLGSLGQADLAAMGDVAHGLLADGGELEPGEGLALLNNNAFATGMAALAVADCERLLDASLVAGALDLEAFAANLSILDPAIARARPYAGLASSLADLRPLLAGRAMFREG